MTLTPEPSLEGLSKPETSAKECMQNEECQSTSIDTMCKPMRIRVKACRKIPWIADGSPDQDALVARRSCGRRIAHRHLSDALFQLVKQWCLPLQELLVVTDG